MFILQILPCLFRRINKTLGKKTALFFFNLIFKNRRFFFIDKIYDFDEKTTVSRLNILLPAKGCEWAKKTGGCTMCAFGKIAEKLGKNFSDKNLLSLFQIAIDFTIVDKPINLTIYNGGSFLNENEIPFETQLKICQKVNEHYSIKKLFVESRVEYITYQKIKILKNILKNKILKIGIGLETYDDKIRNTFIKKGLDKKDYERIIKLLKENGVKVITYVFLKPIYVTEKQAIDEAIKTIEYAFKVGTDEVALEAGFVQEGTIMDKLFKKNKYKPPWLWSIIKVIRKTYNFGPIHVGSFEDEPPPIAISSNCPFCSLKIKKILKKYKETHNIDLFKDLRCSCYELWKKEIGN